MAAVSVLLGVAAAGLVFLGPACTVAVAASEAGVAVVSMTEGAAEGAEVAVTNLQAIRAVLQGTRVLTLAGKVTGAVGAGSLLLGVLDGGVKIRDSVTKSQVQDQLASVLNNLQEAIKQTVIWPSKTDDLVIDSVSLNQSLVFGFVDKQSA